jgi:hypothetical protein
MAAVLPKATADGIALAGPIFDHSKIAIVDDIVRLGVPPGNPFFGETGTPSRLSYYYLWHFSAAELALLTGGNGWAADAGLTWFTTFAALGLMAALALWLSGSAASMLWVVALAATGSARPILDAFAGSDSVERWAGDRSGFGGFLFQSSWAPQHLAAAVCAILAALALVRLAQRPNLPSLLTAGLVMTAGYESSVWVGGITFALAGALIGPLLLMVAAPGLRLRTALWLAGAAGLALALASPLLYDQSASAARHGVHSPVILSPQSVIGFDWPDGIVRLLDLPAYWLTFLPVELPAFYVTGAVAIVVSLKYGQPKSDDETIVPVLAVLTAVSLCVGWLLVSTLGENNDLGWRGVLPAVMLLIVFASAGFTRVVQKPFSVTAVAMLIWLALGVPDGTRTIYTNIVAGSVPSSKAFSASEAMWQAVRRHSGPADRIAINPYFLADLTPWPIDIAWAVLSDRRSCYAGPGYAPFIPKPQAVVDAIDAQFARVFDGKSTADDIAELAVRYRCDLAVVTPSDAAWRADPFAANPLYRLAEESTGWRIYKHNQPPPR